jgi:uncharacterized protein YybS (DUF2232 family)
MLSSSCNVVTVPNYVMKNGAFLYATTNMDHIIATPLFMLITITPYPLPGILTTILNTHTMPSSVYYTFTNHGSYHMRAVKKS